MSGLDHGAGQRSRLRLVPGLEHDQGARRLPQGQIQALRQLERRLRTGDLEPVNIRAAQQLAALGLAQHGRGGWRPTKEGLSYLDRI